MTKLIELLRRRQNLDGMSDEIRAHLGEKVDALVARGMSRGIGPPDAEADRSMPLRVPRVTLPVTSGAVQ